MKSTYAKDMVGKEGLRPCADAEALAQASVAHKNEKPTYAEASVGEGGAIVDKFRTCSEMICKQF